MSDDTPNLPVPYIDKPSVEADLTAAAVRIMAHHSTVCAAKTAWLRIGAEFAMAKARTSHGRFGTFCEQFESIGYNQRTIERLMLAAQGVGEKIDTLSNLGISKTVVYALTKPTTPAPILAGFLSKLEDTSDKCTVQAAVNEATKAIKDVDAARKVEARRAKMTPEAKADADKREAATLKRHERELAKRDAEEAERLKCAAEAVALIRARLGAEVDTFTALADRAGYGFAGLVLALREPPPDPPAVEAEDDVLTAEPAESEGADEVPIAPSLVASASRRGAASIERLAQYRRPAQGDSNAP